MESEKQELLMASDAGYGFICKFEDLIARNKSRKSLDFFARKCESLET